MAGHLPGLFSATVASMLVLLPGRLSLGSNTVNARVLLGGITDE